MQIERIGDNETKVYTSVYTVLFSYNTPVGFFNGNKYYRTDEFHSRTTSRHINKWLEGISADRISQITQKDIEQVANNL